MPVRAPLLDTLQQVASPVPYALIDYPNYLNPGDCAIWLGSVEALTVLNGRAPSYASTLSEFSTERCRRAIGNGTVYFAGGGNFGNLYTKHHHARLKVLASLPDNPAVLLPLSCAWTGSPDHALVEETRKVLDRLASITAFARERKTQDELNTMFGLKAALCPDLAHVLEFNVPAQGLGITKLLRTDPEQLAAYTVAQDTTDWRDIPAQRRWNRLGKVLLALSPQWLEHATQTFVARRKLGNAVAFLAKRRLVITDRLHGMILADAIGREVIAMPNSTGKVAAYHREWSGLMPNVRIAGDRAEAEALMADANSKAVL